MKIPFLQGEKNNEEIIEVAIDSIKPNPYQPRIIFNEEEIKKLAESIKNYGIIQPITIRKNRDEEYELIAGERRLRASKVAGIKKIAAVLRELDDLQMAEIALVENLQRKDLNYLEEALAYQKLLEKFKLTQKDLAVRIGKSQSTIANKLRILTLNPELLREINTNIITERHARALLKLTDNSKQMGILKRIKEKELTVKETEKQIEHLLQGDKRKKPNYKAHYKDLRIFKNSLNKTIKEMKIAGLKVNVEEREEEDYIEFKIKLPKKQ